MMGLMPDAEYVAPKRAGILDVAERAGVSRQTVSRAMNGESRISDATRERVLQAARELHYRPSRFGRGLVTKGAPTIGLVIVDLRNSFWAELASNVLESAARRGWRVLIAETVHGGAEAVESLADQVDAIFGHLEMTDAQIEEAFGPMPVVLFERVWSPQSRALITIDVEDGIEALVSHLEDRGHHRLAMLDWSYDGGLSERATHFVRALEQRRLEPRVLMTRTDRDPDFDGAGAAAETAMERWPDTDALVCFNDLVAVGAIKRLASKGIRIPHDVAVSGVDGIPLGTVIFPELTTLQLDFTQVADQAVDLLDRISTGAAPLRGERVFHKIATALVVRDST